MVNKKVKFAPKEVINDLDMLSKEAKELGLKFPLGVLMHVIDVSLGSPNQYEPYSYMDTEEKQIAVIQHILGIERLQPERESHWTVEKEINGYTKSLVFENGETNFREYTDGATYMFGLTEEQARGYAELFGGEPKEIK